jgi:competence protein ComGC
MKRGITIVELLYILFIVGILVILIWTICGSNWTAKRFGGTINEKVSAKVINITWKDNNLWVLHREPREGEKPEVLTFQEYSNLGILQGKVMITETFEATKAEKGKE